MRKVEKEKQEVIEITQDVKVAKDTILEKGDRIEVLGKEKLKESDYFKLVTPLTNMILDAYQEQGINYVSSELSMLFEEVKDSFTGNFMNNEVYSLLTDIIFAINND